MSVDLGPSGGNGAQLSDEEVIALARDAIHASREEIQRTRDDGIASELQQPGITVDLGHKGIVRLPDEVIDIIKDEIERLAISHNRVTSFPARLSECKRLRYLNVRYNQLKEVPKPILQLSSLEILDISRNRLKSLPEEIRQLTSLKVLAISRNKIEKLPLCIGEMSSLRMLKLDDNPLTFPPPEVWKPDASMTTPASGVAEVEAQTTTAIKRYLRSVAGAANNRQRLLVESDSEQSGDSMDTPRPPRPSRTRFPVRPSLSSLDGSTTSLATSPEAGSLIADSSHQRMRSSHSHGSASGARAALLSPPQIVETTHWAPDDIKHEITVRPRRYGLVTPRLTEPPGFLRGLGSETPPESSTVPTSVFSTPDVQYSRHTGNHPREVVSIVLDLMETVINITQQLGDRIRNLVIAVNWRENLDVRDELVRHAQTVEVVTTNINVACDQAGEEFESNLDSYSHLSVHLVVRRLAKPIADAMQLSTILLNCVSRHAVFIEMRSNSQARNLIWLLAQLDAEISGALFSLFQMLHPGSMQHTNTMVASQIPLQPGIVPEFRKPSSLPRGSSPRRKQLSNSSSRSGSRWRHADERMSQSSIGGSSALYDSMFENIMSMLKKQVEYGSSNMANLYSNLQVEYQEMDRKYGQRNELSVVNDLLINTAKYLQSVESLREQLDILNLQDSEGRNSIEFWASAATTLHEFSELGQTCLSIKEPALQNLKQEVKKVMKPLHAILKETSSLIKASPWAEWLGGPDQVKHKKNLSGGSVPPTPLSAALGPAAQAAQATMPGGFTNLSTGGFGATGKGGPGKITFNERFEKYQASQQQQRTAPGHGRRY